MSNQNDFDGLLSLRTGLLDLVKNRDLEPLTLRVLGMLMLIATSPGPHTIRGLAATLRLQKPIVTRGVTTLEERVLAVRCPDLRDRRSVLVKPTERGRKLVTRLGGAMVEADAAQGGSVPQRESAG